MGDILRIDNNPLLDENIKKLNTGDMILCHGGHGDDVIDDAIQFFTKSPWEHAAMIIKDPWWTSPPMKGVYVFQSGDGPNSYKDVLNGKVSGVTLNRLYDFLANRQGVYVRSLNIPDMNNRDKLLFKEFFEIAHGKPYDTNVCSWIGVGMGSFCGCRCLSRLCTPRETDTFWCSALVSFMYERMEWHKTDDWSCNTPADLSKWQLIEPLSLSDTWLLK